jgi:hypothetical protein
LLGARYGVSGPQPASRLTDMWNRKKEKTRAPGF